MILAMNLYMFNEISNPSTQTTKLQLLFVGSQLVAMPVGES